jgi:hypothetical protein
MHKYDGFENNDKVFRKTRKIDPENRLALIKKIQNLKKCNKIYKNIRDEKKIYGEKNSQKY